MTTTRRIMITLMVVALFGFVTAAARADWNPGDPAKWVQLPDLTDMGMDVRATTPKMLADDFECTSTGPITDIHIWGSWLNDELPGRIQGDLLIRDAGYVDFDLTIYSDIPADQSPTGYSMPGNVLWQGFFDPGEFAVREYAKVIEGEGWYDPNTGEFIFPADHVVYQYNFLIDEAVAFLQEGTPERPVTYWLGLEAFPETVAGIGDEPLFGWKTSFEHWNDDAVYRDDPNEPDWDELRYPSAHELAGQSIDLAFVITPEPATLGLLLMGGLAMLRRRW